MLDGLCRPNGHIINKQVNMGMGVIIVVRTFMTVGNIRDHIGREIKIILQFVTVFFTQIADIIPLILSFYRKSLLFDHFPHP